MENTYISFLLVIFAHGLYHYSKSTDFPSIFSIIVFIKEIKKGSTFLIVDLVTRNFKLQFILLSFQFIVSFLDLNLFNFQSGTLGLWFNYMTIFCWLNPKPIKFCCFNIKFNRKFYPLVFGLMIGLWNW